MNAQVKRAKSPALGKKCNPNSGPTKHRKGPKGLSGTEKDYFKLKSQTILEAYRISGNLPNYLSQCFD